MSLRLQAVVVTLNAPCDELKIREMAGASEGAGGAAFARTLSALKERGSNLLVVGTALEDGHVAVCDRLLGETDVQRRRLLVRTDGDCGAIPDDGGAETLFVEQRAPGFDEATAAAGAVHDRVAVGAIDALEGAIVDGYDALAAGEDPDPGELRLCVDSLRPLLVEHSPDRVRRFVDRVGTHVAGADGMGHYHLPTRSGDRYVSLLTPVVDAVVEVRSREGGPQQRWHVFDGAVDSGWLPL